MVAYLDKDSEIARLNYLITGYHEAIKVLRESKDQEIEKLKDEIADLEDRIATQGRSIGNYQSRALQEAREYDPFVCPRRQDACIGCPHTACPQRTEKTRSPKDEPELVICPHCHKSIIDDGEGENK